MTPPSGSGRGEAPGLSAKDTVRFIMAWVGAMARRRGWGELRIVVQDGQITFVHESESHRNHLRIIDPAVQREP